MTTVSQRLGLLERALYEVICCPVCRHDLGFVPSEELRCTQCSRLYPVVDGILCLMDKDLTSRQCEERFLREKVAREHRCRMPAEILEIVQQHHSVSVMQRRASQFRQQFHNVDWLLDVGCGTGYYWQHTMDLGNILLMDFAVENLRTAKTILGNRNDFVYVQADADLLPIKKSSLSGLWSVQTTQHFPDPVMKRFMERLKECLKDSFRIEVYNLNPALFHKWVYKLLGKQRDLKGEMQKVRLNLMNRDQLMALWKDMGNHAEINVGYSEYLFHPDFRFMPKGKNIDNIENFICGFNKLGVLFARQTHISIASTSRKRIEMLRNTAYHWPLTWRKIWSKILLIISLARVRPNITLRTLLRTLFYVPSIFRWIFLKLLRKPVLPRRRFPPYLEDTKAAWMRPYEFRPFDRAESLPDITTMEVFSSIAPKMLPLATCDLAVEGGIDWERKFSDEEDYYALHRWIWLLRLLSSSRNFKDLVSWGVYWMDDWIRKYIECDNNLHKWDAYTTSDRISNGILFLYLCNIKGGKNLESAMSLMARDVVHNLEYYGDGTFNHIINNARALYLYGSYYTNHLYQDVARKILRNELRSLITEDGFLREGSSHYHFLFCRWLLEILFFAFKYDDKNLIDEIKELVQLLIKRCHFFLVFDPAKQDVIMPLIGDVSPDCPPSWLRHLPFSTPALHFGRFHPEQLFAQPQPLKGWANLFADFFDAKEEVSFAAETVKEQYEVFVSSGWYRFNVGEITLFVYVRPANTLRLNGHFHNDNLSFCLFVRGVEILSDGGRFSYKNNKFGNYGTSAHAHNSVIIDGSEPIPFVRSPHVWKIFSPEFFEPQVKWETTGDIVHIFFSYRGYDHLKAGGIFYRRELVVDHRKRYLEIVDEFTGKGKHTVETFFHVGRGMRFCERDGKGYFVFKDREETITVALECLSKVDKDPSKVAVLEGDEDLPAGWFFEQYGKREPIPTVILKTVEAVPLKKRYRWTWTDEKTYR